MSLDFPPRAVCPILTPEQCSEHFLLPTFSVAVINNERNNSKGTSEHSVKLENKTSISYNNWTSYNGGKSCTVESIIASLWLCQQSWETMLDTWQAN